MATLIHDDGTTSTDFASAFGILPQIDLSIDRSSRDSSGSLQREVHRITLKSDIKPDRDTTPNMQGDITDRLALLLSLVEGRDGARVSLTFTDNGGEIAWAYDQLSGATAAQIAWTTKHGLKITSYDLPHSPAEYVTHKQYSITFEGEVYSSECIGEPIPNIASFDYRTTMTWDSSGLLHTLSYDGVFCKCEGGDLRALFESLKTGYFKDKAVDEFTAAGISISPNFGDPPMFSSLNIDDKDEICASFSLQYGGGSLVGFDSEHLFVQATRNMTKNEGRLSVTGTYTYKGPALPAAMPPLFGGLSTQNTFSAVKKEAEDFRGIDPKVFLPATGGGGILLDEIEDLRFDDVAKTITATRHYRLIWRHDDAIVGFDMTLSVSMSRQAETGHRLCYKKNDAPGPMPMEPLAYRQISGLGLHIISVRATISRVGATAAYTLDDIITVDGDNVRRIEPDTIEVGSYTPNVHVGRLAHAPNPPYIATSTIVRTYSVRDLSGAAAGILIVGSVHNIGALGWAKASGATGITQHPGIYI